MKKLFDVNLVCPFCGKLITYNMLSFKAKHECEHCEYDLFIRMKPVVSTIITLIGFILVLGLASVFGIDRSQKVLFLCFVLGIGGLYMAIVFKVLSKLFGPKFLYVCDAQDPTMLERYRNNKK